MAFINYLYHRWIYPNDRKRDEGKPLPNGLIEDRDIAYLPSEGKWGLMDVYRPKDKAGKLPLILVVHGGGFLYGDKEIYRRYAMWLAADGYVVSCHNYSLAPRRRFPFQLSCIDKVLAYLKANDHWDIDWSRVYLYGDSAGANLSFQYGLLQSNAEYRKLFPGFQLPAKVSGLSLNCGLYGDLGTEKGHGFSVMWHCYLPRGQRNDPRYALIANLTEAFPPTYLMTSDGDFIRGENPPLLKALEEKGIPHLYEDYVGKEGKLDHVFHLDVETEEGKAVRAASEGFLAGFSS